MSDATKRRQMPDGLFVRQPEAEQAQGMPLVGVLFLLTRTSDPRYLAERLGVHLADPDGLPTDGAVMPLWINEADAWDCDAPMRAAAVVKLDGCTVIALALVPGEDADRILYEPMPADLAAEAIAVLHKVLRDEA